MQFTFAIDGETHKSSGVVFVVEFEQFFSNVYASCIRSRMERDLVTCRVFEKNIHDNLFNSTEAAAITFFFCKHICVKR